MNTTNKIDHYSNQYLNEVTQDNIISDLEGLGDRIGGLIKSYSVSKIDMDNETKLKLLTMASNSLMTISNEMSKLLSIQKKNGRSRGNR